MTVRQSSILLTLLGGALMLAHPGCGGSGGSFFPPPGGGGNDAGANVDSGGGGGGSGCNNKKQDGAETDVDCGGDTCAKCGVGLACQGNADCSGTWNPAHIALVPAPVLARVR